MKKIDFNMVIPYIPLIAAILTFIVSYAVYRFNKYKLYVDFITRERMKWLENIRNDFSKLYSEISTFVSKDSITPEICSNVYYYSIKLKIYLNPNGAKEQKIIEKLEELDKKFRGVAELYKMKENSKSLPSETVASGIFTIEDILSSLLDMSKLISNMLKDEWENIKNEVKPKKLLLRIF